MDTPIKKGFFQTYRPLFLIVGLILLASVASAYPQFQWHMVMTHFMAGFFLVFSGLKLLDVPGFARGYAKYDLLAAHVRAYGFAYPFLELALGLLYLTGIAPWHTNIATVVLMSFSGIGVVRKLLKREEFQCACLGTFINVPLTKITVVEDFGMAAMALLMLW